jgi:hypothetical protein
LAATLVGGEERPTPRGHCEQELHQDIEHP